MSGRDVVGYLQRQVREVAKKRAYCKNTVAGKQRGKKYPEAPQRGVSYEAGANEAECLCPHSGRSPKGKLFG